MSTTKSLSTIISSAAVARHLITSGVLFTKQSVCVLRNGLAHLLDVNRPDVSRITAGRGVEAGVMDIRRTVVNVIVSQALKPCPAYGCLNLARF